MEYILTSNNIVLEVTAERRGDTDTNHIQEFVFSSVSGSFVLWVNGRLTSAITYSVVAATTQSNIISALNAATGLTWAAVSGATPNRMSVRCTTASRWFQIRVVGQPTTGLVTTGVVSAGRQSYTLSSTLTALQIQSNTEYTDVTPLMRKQEVVVPTKEVVTVSINLYNPDSMVGDASWDYLIVEGNTVRLDVYEQGKITGGRRFAMYLLIEDVQRNHTTTVVEYQISGRRQGEWVLPLGTRIT